MAHSIDTRTVNIRDQRKRIESYRVVFVCKNNFCFPLNSIVWMILNLGIQIKIGKLLLLLLLLLSPFLVDNRSDFLKAGLGRLTKEPAIWLALLWNRENADTFENRSVPFPGDIVWKLIDSRESTIMDFLSPYAKQAIYIWCPGGGNRFGSTSVLNKLNFERVTSVSWATVQKHGFQFSRL